MSNFQRYVLYPRACPGFSIRVPLGPHLFAAVFFPLTGQSPDVEYNIASNPLPLTSTTQVFSGMFFPPPPPFNRLPFSPLPSLTSISFGLLASTGSTSFRPQSESQLCFSSPPPSPPPFFGRRTRLLGFRPWVPHPVVLNVSPYPLPHPSLSDNLFPVQLLFLSESGALVFPSGISPAKCRSLGVTNPMGVFVGFWTRPDASFFFPPRPFSPGSVALQMPFPSELHGFYNFLKVIYCTDGALLVQRRI